MPPHHPQVLSLLPIHPAIQVVCIMYLLNIKLMMLILKNNSLYCLLNLSNLLLLSLFHFLYLLWSLLLLLFNPLLFHLLALLLLQFMIWAHEFGVLLMLCFTLEGWALDQILTLKPKFGKCCLSGKVHLPPLDPPPELQNLFVSQDPRAKAFHNHICKYNNALTLTSVGWELDQSLLREGGGPYVFKVHGFLSHRARSYARTAKHASLSSPWSHFVQNSLGVNKEHAIWTTIHHRSSLFVSNRSTLL